MQTARTLRGTKSISLLILLVSLIGYAYPNPIQYLPSIPGYIPVYIRYGDEPLEGINPELAEAFGETSNSDKSLQKIDHTLAHESDNFKDDDIDTFLEESKREHAYPLHVREAESRSFTAANEPGHSDKPKLLTIYTLPDDNENRPRRRYRGRSRLKSHRKQPAFKTSPLSDEEIEKLEKLAIEVEKEETKPNELYAPNPRHSGSSENTHNRYRTHNFIAPMKVQIPLGGTLADLPKTSGISDFSHSDRDIATFDAEKEEPPIKGQRPATFWSNINKISPINLPNENEPNKDATFKAEKIEKKSLGIKINLPEISQDIDLSKSSDEHNTAETDCNKPAIKVQNPTTILSNVDKISPINLPNENKTNKDSIFKAEKIEEKSLGMKINLPEIPQDIDLSKSSYEHNMAETDDNKPPIKVQNPTKILSNVDKISPIDLPNENKTNKDIIFKTEKNEEKSLNMKIDVPEMAQATDLSKSSDKLDIATAETDCNKPPIKVQRPTTILSNVDKISPIDLPNKNKTKDFAQPIDEVATD